MKILKMIKFIYAVSQNVSFKEVLIEGGTRTGKCCRTQFNWIIPIQNNNKQSGGLL